MIIANSKLINTAVFSVASGKLGYITRVIVDPDNLKVIAFRLSGPQFNRNDPTILDISSIREYSPKFGFIIDNVSDLVSDDEVIKIKEILTLNFDLNSLKVETKKRNRLGTVIDYTVNLETYLVHQIIVKRPLTKSFIDPELTISRNEIVEITDYKVIVKSEYKTLKEKAAKEEFVPNFINPFRKSEQDFVPVDSQTPVDKDN